MRSFLGEKQSKNEDFCTDMIMTWLISWERVCYSSSNEFLCCSLLRSAEDTSEVQFDPDSFLQTVEDMLGMYTAIQDASL